MQYDDNTIAMLNLSEGDFVIYAGSTTFDNESYSTT